MYTFFRVSRTVAGKILQRTKRVGSNDFESSINRYRFQVQFNAEFPRQIINFPVVFFGEAKKIQSMKGLVSANYFC